MTIYGILKRRIGFESVNCIAATQDFSEVPRLISRSIAIEGRNARKYEYSVDERSCAAPKFWRWDKKLNVLVEAIPDRERPQKFAC